MSNVRINLDDRKQMNNFEAGLISADIQFTWESVQETNVDPFSETGVTVTTYRASI
jgi:hypothetical protein